MQIAVAEFARNVCGMAGANSTEFDPETPFPVVDLLPEQKEVSDMGGTMRLGAEPVKLHEGSRARAIFDDEGVIYKRHRHRYEVNNQLRRRLEDEGLVAGGTSPDERLVEMIELADHPFYVASQFHLEFNSRPTRPSRCSRVRRRCGAPRAPSGTRGWPRRRPQSRRAPRRTTCAFAARRSSAVSSRRGRPRSVPLRVAGPLGRERRRLGGTVSSSGARPRGSPPADRAARSESGRHDPRRRGRDRRHGVSRGRASSAMTGD